MATITSTGGKQENSLHKEVLLSILNSLPISLLVPLSSITGEGENVLCIHFLHPKDNFIKLSCLPLITLFLNGEIPESLDFLHNRCVSTT